MLSLGLRFFVLRGVNPRGSLMIVPVFECMSEILRQGEAHGWIRPLELSIVQNIGAAVRCAAENLGPVVNSVVPYIVEIIFLE